MLGARGAGFGSPLSTENFTQDAVTATGLTVPAGAKSALITVGGQAVRYRSDATDPTSTVGHFVAANGNIEVFGNELASIKLISTSATSDIFITYYGD